MVATLIETSEASGTSNPREEVPIQMDDRKHRLRGPNVGDQHQQIVIQRKLRRTASARRLDCGAFFDPALRLKLLDDGGYGAGLQTGQARQIHPGNGLRGADVFEDQVAIDVAGQLAGGDLYIGKLADRTLQRLGAVRPARFFDGLVRLRFASLGEIEQLRLACHHYLT